MPESDEPKYAIFCEATGHDRPLVMHDLSFPQVIDEVVVPLEGGKPFFVDGAPLTKVIVTRLKVLEQKDLFRRAFTDLHWQMRSHSDVKLRQVLGEQYHVRLEAVLRETGRDVTAQVMRAFDSSVKPKLRDYLPNRQEVLSAALAVFKEGMKLHGSAG